MWVDKIKELNESSTKEEQPAKKALLKKDFAET